MAFVRAHRGGGAGHSEGRPGDESGAATTGRFERYQFARSLGVDAIRGMALRAVASGLRGMAGRAGRGLPELSGTKM
jgi:hypothetical protein